MTTPHNPQPEAKRGTHLVYKPVVCSQPSDQAVAVQGIQLKIGGLPLTLGTAREADNQDVHKSLSTGDRLPARHTPVPHELRHALSTARTLCNQLEIANRPVELRVALWLREQVLLALLELEGYREVDSSGSGVVPDPA